MIIEQFDAKQLRLSAQNLGPTQENPRIKKNGTKEEKEETLNLGSRYQMMVECFSYSWI